MADDSLEAIFKERREIRRQERRQRRAFNMSKYVETGVRERGIGGLQKILKDTIPPHMRPGNVGGYNKITWPFWYQVNFDFGTNPTWTSGVNQRQSFQVTQEAAWLMTSITLKNNGYDLSSALAPLQIEIRDRQSSRQLNSAPIPLQMFGKNSLPSTMPTPMLFMPNAFIDIIATSWVPQGESMASTGDGEFQLSFFGYRVRVEDADKVLSTIFG
jgi:hypothetical protein